MRSRKLIELDDVHGRAAATERFLAHLHRSSEMLRTDRVEEARRLLEEAFENQSMDPTGQATLALVYFKLGLYPRALALYQKLAIDYPDDPVLHLNLALVLFKTGQTTEARDTLRSVVEMAPDYRKAYGYLGLASQRLGDYPGAVEAYRKAGVEHMAQRMARFIAPDGGAPGNPEDATPLDDALPSIPPPPQPDPERSRDSRIPALATGTPVSLAPAGRAQMEPLPVSDLARETRFEEPLEGRFLISGSGYLLATVADRVISRLRGLHFCSSEGLSYREIGKRTRGAGSEEGFGGADGPMYEIEGTGRLGFSPDAGVFSAVSLDDEIAYVREEMLFAFDPDLSFENGQMPRDLAPLVHLKGRGSLVLRCPVAPHSLEVTPERGVIIPAAGMVGWFGRLLPRPARGGPFDPGLETVEFVGEGILLFCLP